MNRFHLDVRVIPFICTLGTLTIKEVITLGRYGHL